jgi:lysophospholipid acyltransferase (LPLAT)-like uncharacterized protein
VRAKHLLRSRPVQQALGRAMAGYLRLVHATSRLASEPGDIEERVRALSPFIIAMWHGQHFMVPFGRPKGMRSAVMVSRHADAEINAIAARAMGIDTIRASGSNRATDTRRKGGISGFREAMRTLESGVSVGLTADVPKGPAKVAGRGIVLLGQHSGRPIVPVAYATSRNIDVGSWDSASVNLPFGRAGFVLGDPVHVPADADDALIEAKREELRLGLDRATARAYELAGVRSKFAAPEDRR